MVGHVAFVVTSYSQGTRTHGQVQVLTSLERNAIEATVQRPLNVISAKSWPYHCALESSHGVVVHIVRVVVRKSMKTLQSGKTILIWAIRN